MDDTGIPILPSPSVPLVGRRLVRCPAVRDGIECRSTAYFSVPAALFDPLWYRRERGEISMGGTVKGETKLTVCVKCKTVYTENDLAAMVCEDLIDRGEAVRDGKTVKPATPPENGTPSP
jgi:hypothetical protein